MRLTGWCGLYCGVGLLCALVCIGHVALLQPSHKLTEEPQAAPAKPAPSRFLQEATKPASLSNDEKIARLSYVPPSYDESKPPAVEKVEELRRLISQLGERKLWSDKQDEAVRLLGEATGRDLHEWREAIKTFKSDKIYRGSVNGGHRLESDKAALAQEVRYLQGQLGACAGPSIVPRTFQISKDYLRKQFCEHSASACGQRTPVWVMKPYGGTFGKGVHKRNFTRMAAPDCVKNLEEGPKDERPYLAQQFLNDPLIVDGGKVEVRFHVLIASTKPWLVLYHPDFVVKHATTSKTFVVNTHKQQVGSLNPEDLVRKIGRGEEALALIRGQLQRIAKLVILGHREANGFRGARPEQWEIYGLDVALMSDLRAYLLDWNFQPGLGMSVTGSQRQSAATVRDMYKIARHKLQGKTGAELSSLARETTWEVALDESQDSSGEVPKPLCTGVWHEELPGSQSVFSSWSEADKAFDDCRQ